MKAPALLSLLLLTTAQAADTPFQPSIERLSPALSSLLPEDAKVELLASGFNWSEGPVWHQGALVFSDVPENTAFQWKEGEKAASIFLKPSGSADPAGQGSNGLALAKDGSLILCQHGDRCVARLEKDGKFTPLASTYEGKRFNSPNDLCIHSDGTIYFTDPSYGIKDKTKRELDYHGIFKLSPDGKVTLLTKEVNWPNGIALSPDEKTLYIAVSDPAQPRVLSMNLDGSNSRILFDATPLKSPTRKGGCDGLKVDQQGNIWTTGPGGVIILNSAGHHLGSILTGQATANCAFGDNGSTLYITADMHLLRVKTSTKGTGF